MDLQSNSAAQSAPEETISVITTQPSEQFSSVSEAARALAQTRHANQENQPDKKPAPKRADAAASVESRQESEAATAADDAAPQRRAEAPGETEGQADPVDNQPPIEPPRSWTKQAKERWQSLPRETQEYLAEREQEREREFRRGQNEAVETRKALDAERSKVEYARQQYESALPLLMQNLQSVMAGEFADIKTMADVQRVAAEDWPRYIRWDAQQKQVAAVQQEIKAAEERRNAEYAQQWNEFAKRQDELFVEKAPEMADKDKAVKLQNAAVSVLKDLGFSDEELSRSFHGKQGMSLRDHRVQLLIRDAILWREAQAKAKIAVTKPVPPVQRPGVSQGKIGEREAQIQHLTQQLDKTSGINALRAAAKLVATRRADR
jgi:hypothetical protein